MKSKYRPIEWHIISKIFILLLLMFYFLPVFAALPDPNGARQKASMFFNSNQPEFSKVKSLNPQELVKAYQSTTSKRTPLFVFQHKTNGFVIVAQNNQQFAIVGYSPEGKFNFDSIPPQLSGLLKLYEDSLQLKEDELPLRANTVVAPLLDEAGISLNQFGHGEAGGCPTGCVATAFTQIMSYYKYPSKGIGSNCYNHAIYGQQCADFENTIYNWTNPTDEDYEKLSYHVGISMDMNYCGSQFGSIPSASDYIERIHKHFGYYLGGGNYDITNQSAYIQSELDNRRPVYIELPGNPGHAVVLDGYDSNGMFHVNFGWGGQYNGYYALNTNSTFNVGYKFGTNIHKAVYLSPSLLKTNMQDSLALVAIHNSFNGTTGWDLKQPVFTWRGVLVVNGRVVSLFMNTGIYSNINGVIPPEIGNLTALQRLNILGMFDGELPASIANLTELRELCIYGGQGTFKARLPQNIGNLTKLETLAIPNKADGEIPASLGSLTQLRTLDLSNGNLSGTLPAGITNLTELENLSLFRNNLSGILPDAIGNLTKLQTLTLSENKFSGSIPASIGNLIKLTNLGLGNNQFSGKIPTSIGKCKLLTNLYLGNNQFEGDIPTEIGNLTNLEYLTLVNNKFESLPNEIGRLKKVFSLDVSNNKLKTLPDSIKEMDLLYEFYAQNNEISQLSRNFGVCKRMQYVNLSNNKLKEFPEELLYARNIASIGLSDNLIEKFPSNIALIPPKLQSLTLDNNNMSGKIPDHLLTNPQLQTVMLRNNRFIYEDLPDSSFIYGQLGNQQRVHLSKSVFRVAMGDTVRINIKDITPFKRAGNEYYWCLYPKFYDTGETGDFPKDSILKVIISEKTINNKYYCKVTNPTAPKYKYEIWTLPALNYVATDTLSFLLSTDEELIAEKYPKGHVVNATGLPGKKVEDRIVTLVPPLKFRGVIKWQASSDSKTWYDLSTTMTQNDLKSNFMTVKSNELVLSPKTPAYYRCSLQDTDCEPMYSDTIKVNPFGKVLLDSVVNVDSGLVKVKTDSIEITLPKGIHKGDFRLTVVKLDNPPPAPEGVKMSSVYDVTVSFGDVFDIPMLIKFKNVPKNIDPMKIDNYQGAYYEDVNQKWVKFENSNLSLKDSTVYLITNHLTKLSWWIHEERFLYGYTDVYIKNNVRVFWKDSHEAIFKTTYGKKQTTQPWHISGIPIMIQDITHFLGEVLLKLKSLGLDVPTETVTVYVNELDDDGVVGIMGMLNYYMTIDRIVDGGPIALRSLLAHEFMHLLQDKYMVSSPGNIFWYEANAHLTDRTVWDQSIIPVSQSDDYLMGSRRKAVSIFNFLGNSWDYWDSSTLTQNLFGNINYCYLAGTFIHYMRSYRNNTKLDVVKLLKNVGWINSAANWTWRAYLYQEVMSQLNTKLGDEYDDFVRYILEGKNENYTLLDLKSPNLYNYIIANAGATGQGTFARSLIYKFEKDNNQPQKDDIDISVDYLSAKMVLLTNQTTDKNVLINYKRKHSANDEYKIYHGLYDLKQKKVVYVDISDSLEYNFLLDPFTDKVVNKHQNIQFLLLVNKKCPSVVGVFTTFKASFELTATPVYDITSLLSAWIESKSKGIFINNYTGNLKNAFIIGGASFNPSAENLTYHTINAYSSTKNVLSQTSYRVIAYFDSETRHDWENNTPGIITFPTIQNITRNMTITYDCVKATLKIEVNSHIINKYETINEEKPRIVKSSDWFENGLLDLVNISSLTPNTTGNLFFSTKNTSETKAAVKNMNFSRREVNFNIDTGAITSEKTSTYIDTDYSTDDVILTVVMNSE